MYVHRWNDLTKPKRNVFFFFYYGIMYNYLTRFSFGNLASRKARNSSKKYTFSLFLSLSQFPKFEHSFITQKILLSFLFLKKILTFHSIKITVRKIFLANLKRGIKMLYNKVKNALNWIVTFNDSKLSYFDDNGCRLLIRIILQIHTYLQIKTIG